MSIAEALQILHNYNAQQQQLVGASLSAMTVAPGIGMPIYPGMVNPPAVPAPLPPGAAPSPFNAAAAAALAAAPGAAATKMQREIYLGNLPPGVSIPQLTDFINVAMRQLGLNTSAPSPAVISAWVSTDGHYAFVELRTIEEANSAMLFLSGFQVGTFVLKVGRPKGNGPSGVTVPIQATPFTAALMGIAPQPPGTPMLGIYPLPPLPSSITQLPNVAGGGVMAMAMPMTSMMGVPGAATSGGAAGLLTAQSNVVMATNLPGVLSDAQIKELLSPFGTVRRFYNSFIVSFLNH
jgi:splicing factor U2AF subunit